MAPPPTPAGPPKAAAAAAGGSLSAEAAAIARAERSQSVEDESAGILAEIENMRMRLDGKADDVEPFASQEAVPDSAKSHGSPLAGRTGAAVAAEEREASCEALRQQLASLIDDMNHMKKNSKSYKNKKAKRRKLENELAALEASRTADMDAVGSHDACGGVEEDGESMVEMASAVDSVKDKAGEVMEPNLRVEGDAAIDVSAEQIEKEAAQEATKVN